ncbi:MAG: hypothetical protein PVH68_01665 [Armatimonadota bacterium]|jgi:hypothetical protein
MARRSRDEQAEHDRVVLLVAQQRFPRETCHVIANPGREENCGLTYVTDHADGYTVYPDIVAVMRPDREIVAVAEVETRSTVTRAHSGQWRLFAQHANAFYLFVPVASVEAAAALVQDVNNLRLRGYSFDPHGNIIVTDVP